MAALLRPTFRLLSSNLSKKSLPLAHTSLISTSNKSKETYDGKWPDVIEIPRKPERNLYDNDENWISYGYDFVDREEDYFAKNMILFAGFTLTIIWGSFFVAYAPDNKMVDWTRREGFLRLAEREAKGLTPIDPNYIPVEKMILPTDEELGDTDVCV